MSPVKKRQSGFTMVEFMLVTMAAAPLILLGSQLLIAYMGRSTGESAIKHQGQVATALSNFTTHNEDILNNVADIQKVRDNVTANREPAWRRVIPRITLAGDAIQQWDGYAFSGNVNDVTTPPAPALLDCPNKDCVTITVKNLQEWGYLPAEFSDTNPLGFTYKLRIKRIPMAAQPGVPAFSALDAVVVANTPGRLTDNNPYGDPDIIIGMQNAPGVQGLGMSRVTEQNDATYFASKGLTGPAVGAVGVYGFDADQSGNLGWFFDPVQWGFDNMVAVLPVIKTALWSGNKDGVYMRIDHPFVRDDLNMMGNSVVNLKQVTLDAPCDPDPIKAKAMSGNLATISATNTDIATGEKLGSGFVLICGYDQAKAGYVWKKATAGALTVEDGKAGMLDGLETTANWSCWGTTAGENATNINGINIIKFVMKWGKAWAYARRDDLSWVNVTRDPNGIDINSVWAWDSTPAFYFTVPVVDNGAWGCKVPANLYIVGRDPMFQVFTGWRFSPNGITFSAQGSWERAVERGAGSENLADIPVPVNNYSLSCTTDPVTGALTGCSLPASPTTAYTTARADAPKVTKPFFVSMPWSWQQRSKCSPAQAMTVYGGDICPN